MHGEREGERDAEHDPVRLRAHGQAGGGAGDREQRPALAAPAAQEAEDEVQGGEHPGGEGDVHVRGVRLREHDRGERVDRTRVAGRERGQGGGAGDPGDGERPDRDGRDLDQAEHLLALAEEAGPGHEHLPVRGVVGAAVLSSLGVMRSSCSQSATVDRW